MVFSYSTEDMFRLNADSEGLCNNVLRSELTSPFTNPTSHELLVWNRKQLSYSDVQKLAAHFGLANPCCLIHRLAVIIGNLFVYKNCDLSEVILLIKSMFNEFHIELKLRYDRLICLPSLSLYEEVYRNVVSDSTETTSSFIDSDRPNLMPWNQSSMMSASELKFNDWLVDVCYSLDYVLNRFNACILKAREGEQNTTSKNNKIPSQSVSSNDEDEDGEAFFDAYDESHSSYHDVENSQQNSQWLDTCFPHPQLSDWYSSLLRKLDEKVYDLLSIRSMKSMSSEEKTSNNNKSSFPYSVFCDVLALISRLSTEITCLNELISNAIICGHGDLLSSNSFLDALCHLSSNMNLKEKDNCTFEPYIFGSWIDLPWTKVSTNMILAFLKTLFDKCVPAELADSEVGKFHFTSVPQTWIPPNRPVDLRRPDMEVYIFYTELGYPNPLVSRLGSQRLFIELAYDKKTSSYTHLKMAGSFSQDTQFF
ncbi:unnamed protein product [Trichobilharzia szidati]|nr:unnamed protein product [Trichobilharzia szidati]